jgi:hypothetical protein
VPLSLGYVPSKPAIGVVAVVPVKKCAQSNSPTPGRTHLPTPHSSPARIHLGCGSASSPLPASQAPVQYYQVAAPLLVALLVVLAVQVKWHQRYFEDDWVGSEERTKRLLPILAALFAVALFAVMTAGFVAALSALQYGPTETTERITSRAVIVSGTITFFAAGFLYLESAARAARRFAWVFYMVAVAVFILVYVFGSRGIPTSH